MIAKYSVDWVKDVINDFDRIIGYEEGLIPQRVQVSFLKDIGPWEDRGRPERQKYPYRISTWNNAVRTTVQIDQKTGERIRVEVCGEPDEIMDQMSLEDRRMVSLYLDTLRDNIASAGLNDRNNIFCRLFNRLFKVWKQNQSGVSIEWGKVSKEILNNIVRYEIDCNESARFAQSIKNEGRFLLCPDEDGFIFENRFYSANTDSLTKLHHTDGFLINLKQYLVVYFLFIHPNHIEHGQPLKSKINDALINTYAIGKTKTESSIRRFFKSGPHHAQKLWGTLIDYGDQKIYTRLLLGPETFAHDYVPKPIDFPPEVIEPLL